jgi:hypothetical protein
MYNKQNIMYNKTFTILEVAMGRFVDRTGQIFGRLQVMSRAGTSHNKKVLWRCVCSCGKEVLVPSGSLVTKNTTSCGCYLKERITKHGGYGKSSYNTWRSMIRRCTVPTDKDYPRWGGLGITVCSKWLEYPNFVADMGEPEGTQTLDRINPYGNYQPDNCRWVVPTIQARNIRIPKTNKAGVIGVINVYANKWMASITANKKRYYAPVRNSITEAAADRKELERLHWGKE